MIIRTPTGLGAGVIINHTGWILTNNHVIEGGGSYKELPFVRPAQEDPAPGEPVARFGHTGSGLVWAIKAGEVAAGGKISTPLSQLVGLECGPGDTKQTPTLFRFDASLPRSRRFLFVPRSEP